MYHYKTTEQISKYFCIAITVILFAGFIAGTTCGNLLSEPTEEALVALDEIARYQARGWDIDSETFEAAEEVKWSLNSTLAMLSIWICSAIGALLLYSKKHYLEMTDTICGSLEKIKSKMDIEMEDKTPAEAEK